MRFPIYVNGGKRFDTDPRGSLTTVEAHEHTNCLFGNIQFCVAESHLMDLDIFDRLDELRDRIRANDNPSFDQIAELVFRIGSRYGFGIKVHSGAAWIREDNSGRMLISIGRDKILAESNVKVLG